MKLVKWTKFFFECETKLLVILLSLFVTGYVWGAFSTNISDVQAIPDLQFVLFNSDLISLFIRYALSLVVVFLLGYCAVGLPFICFIMIYNGLCFGIFSEALLINYGFRNNVIVIVFLFFSVITYFISLSCVSFSSIRLSLTLFSVFRSETRYVSPSYYSTPHIIKFVFFAIAGFMNCIFIRLISVLVIKMIS